MKKVIYVILALVMFITPLNFGYATAAANETSLEESINALSLNKGNYNYLEGKLGDTHLIYTYESNGSTYKVIENASEDFDEVYSTIYIKNSTGEFVEYATQNLTINNSNLIHTTKVSGEEITEIKDLSFEKSEITNGTPPFNSVMSINGTCYGQPVGGWAYISRNNGSTVIANYTASAVVAAVTYIASAGAGVAAGAAKAAISAIAAKVVDSRIPTLYYTQWYHELKLANPGRGQENFIVGTNHFTDWYDNSFRTSYINTTDVYTYHACHRF
ncbi:hypothetical protein P9B03_15450 [Metasolibacillus meyeri]|uniref:Uncharacterized protein n=1 Tax=Metasolibacillus meyeri TaxID=1071052 RepID=A0AAW9NQR0_9BACL|nr:hypothetical protein [Metasolibacillus meyeri]MEC1179895.1 hypothetical protein [Metasolibacillus meyeri]